MKDDGNSNSNSTALVVHDDGNTNDGVVLDALPYVEHLDESYENYALQLIGQELESVVNEAQRESESDSQNGELEHPLMRRILSSSKIYNDVDPPLLFGGNAPLATAAYRSLVQQRNNGDESPKSTFKFTRPNPMAEDQSSSDPIQLIGKLQTSIETSKIEHETQRLRFTNLELFQHFETPAQFTNYNGMLEEQYVKPTLSMLENQRRKVDGINATRMEDQQRVVGRLDTLSRKWYELVDKNERLGRAIGGLESEVVELRKKAG